MKVVGYLLVSMLAISAFFAVLTPVTAHAQEGTSCNDTFLGFPAWYNGLTDSECSIVSPNDDSIGGLDRFIWVIVLNVVEMLLRAAGYAAVGFIIYGGYKYMVSAGSPDGMVSARKTIMNACIGLVISIAAVAIVNTVAGGMKIGGSAAQGDDDDTSQSIERRLAIIKVNTII